MIENILIQLKAYKKKYYQNQLLKGALLGVGLLAAAYLLVNVLEYYGNFGKGVRTTLFFSFWGVLAFVFVRWILIPVARLLNLNKALSDEQAAQQIGQFFPEIKDKLLNTLQLSQMTVAENSLLQASIAQKTQELSVVPFTQAINFGENRKYLRYAVPPIGIIILILLFVPQLFTESTTRIWRYQETYLPKAPFDFVLQNSDLKAYQGEDYDIKLRIAGQALPAQVYLQLDGNRKQKMELQANGDYTFTLKNIQKPVGFSFEAAGFNSAEYDLELISRPNLTGFNARLEYPAYLHKRNENLSNVGNFTVPAGTLVRWDFEGIATDSLYVVAGGQMLAAEPESDNHFKASRKFVRSTDYEIKLKNKQAANKENIKYRVDVIPDLHPQITLEQYRDTALFNFMVLGGNISDDYGLTRLQLTYKVTDSKGHLRQKEKHVPIRINSGQASQSYLYQWNIDSLHLKPNESLEYFVTVWDNDGVSGAKSSRSRSYQFQMPSAQDFEKEMDASAEKTEKALDANTNKANELRKELQKVKDRLRGKKTLSWQDKKAIEELLKKKEDLQKQIEQMQKENDLNKEKQERFGQQSQDIKEKYENLQKLMNELLDDKTKKLYEELQKLLEEKTSPEQLQNTLEKIDKQEKNLSKELDRALELFKKLQFEQKMEQSVKKLDELAEKQEKLAEKTEQQQDKKGNEAAQEELKKEQEELNKMFEELKEDLKALEELNKGMEDPSEMPDTENEQQNVDSEQENSSEQLNQKQNSKAAKSQKNAAKEMKKMSKSLQASMESQESQENEENMEDLRNILENLITLSFDQEDLMKEFRQVNQLDPRYITLSQQQLKLKDDAVVIEDSLNALAKRVFQIQSFVTREVGEMKGNMEESVEAIRQRRQGVAAGKQQLAMTSMNNLALLLNDVLKQMQEQMAQSKPGSGKGKKKGKQKGGAGGMSELQKQLNQRIEGLKKSGKSGRELSEELAKLASEQEALRKALQEMEKMSGGGENGGEGGEKEGGQKAGNKLSELKKEMEKTEQDLVNKRITQETINRQREILTRLLEAENAMRQREQDPKRESRTGKELTRQIPPSFEQYLKQKEKQVELLKTISPAVTPFYKQETNRYFQELKN
ncbi:protein of unknown function [Flexibacter flexilis DSM 6793]|uniref:ATPase n=1 Tax=Flexibacter flexilis DSM 6793 TaxID=927664 RepID=A0A1I1K4V7_9BACT|nr:DUF4175 family protein [Flexibacter flexilis]SFC55645.1 protein of unknown function [Flexibacter flexilis DSM 6793]